MGSSQSHPSRIVQVDTGCLVNAHSNDKGKYGPGGAAMCLIGDTNSEYLYLAGNKGMAIYDCKNLREISEAMSNTKQSESQSGSDSKKLQIPENGILPRIGNIIDTNAIAHDSGVSLQYYEKTGSDIPNGGVLKLLYVIGGKGMVIYDVSTPTAPKKLTSEAIQTGALTHNSGAASLIDKEKELLYIAGGNGLVVYSIKGGENDYGNAINPKKVSGPGDTVINTKCLACTGGASMKFIYDTKDPNIKHLYIAGGKGIQVLDITSNPEVPTPYTMDILNTKCISSVGCPALCQIPIESESSGNNGSSKYDPNILFVAGGRALGIINITDPKNPKMVGSKINTGVLANDGGSAMVVDSSDQLYGKTKTLLIAGGKGLGVFTLPNSRDMLLGGSSDNSSGNSNYRPERKGKIETGALSRDNESCILLDEKNRFLFVCGGNGLAVFDLSKFDGATTTIELNIEDKDDDFDEVE